MSPLSPLRAACLRLPNATERESHGTPSWFVGSGKMFATFDDHHHGAAHHGVWLAQPPGVQERLVAADARRYFRPPYVGHRGWVGVVLDDGPDWGEVSALIEAAWLHVAPITLRRQWIATR